MPKEKGTHSINRTKVCLFCQKKPKAAFKIQGMIELKIQNLFPDLEVSDNRLPTVICNVCRQKLYKNNCTIIVPDYSSNSHLDINGDGICVGCSLCRLVQDRQSKFPAVQTRKKSKKKEKIIRKQCVKCASFITRGRKHECHLKHLLHNIVEMIKNHWHEKVYQQIAANLIKKIIGKNSVPSNKTLKLSQIKGQALEILARPKNKEEIEISNEIMCTLQVTLNLSENQTLKAAQVLRNGSRKVLEPNLKKELKTRSRVLDNFFECVEFEFTLESNEEGKKIKQKAIVCKDLSQFIEFVLDSRGITDNHHLKFGVDGGGKFLKFCLSIQSKDVLEFDQTDQKQKSFAFKDSGVKKLFVIAIAQNIPENHYNINLIWKKLQINKFLTKSRDGTVTTDLKVANILFGLMNHSSSHPCTWCLSKKNTLHIIGEMRTIARCNENFNRFNDTNKARKDARKFYNCVNMPIIQSDKELILHILPPPELHLLLGCTNHMYNHMLAEFPSIATLWAKQCNVYRVDVYRGTMGFEGNQCKGLLNNTDKLRSLCMKYDIGCLKFVDAFLSFQKVVHSCFSLKLQPNFETCIDDFEIRFKVLQISVTSKIHAIFFHVKQFCKTFDIGLGFFSEQAFESVHHDYTKTWQNFKVNVDNPDYGEKLLRAVCSYNCKHL